MDIKIEIKEEPFFCRMADDLFPKEIKENIWSETCSINYVINNKTEIKEEILPSNFVEPPVVNFHNFSRYCEEDTKIVIKEEKCYLDGSPSLCNQNKDGTDDISSPESSRLLTRVASSSKSDLLCNEGLGNTKHMRSDNKADSNFGNQGTDIAEISSNREFIHSDEVHGTEMENKNSSSSLFQQDNIKKKAAYKSVFVKCISSSESTKPYKCQICDKGFTRLSNLKKHNFIHEDELPYKCDICDKSFTRLSTLKTHNLIHEGNKPHKCGVCGKGFTLLTNLKKHKYIHEAVKPYQCDICQKGFTQLHSLKGHILIHQGIKPHKCDICKRSFRLLLSLKRHKYVHNDIKPYKCNICQSGFTLLHSLKDHILIHAHVKSYRCDTCGKGFTRLLSLKRHNLIHEGKKPYSTSLKRLEGKNGIQL